MFRLGEILDELREKEIELLNAQGRENATVSFLLNEEAQPYARSVRFSNPNAAAVNLHSQKEQSYRKIGHLTGSSSTSTSAVTNEYYLSPRLRSTAPRSARLSPNRRLSHPNSPRNTISTPLSRNSEPELPSSLISARAAVNGVNLKRSRSEQVMVRIGSLLCLILLILIRVAYRSVSNHSTARERVGHPCAFAQRFIPHMVIFV